jgi:uncharacterized protein (DUF1778 family)
MSKTEIMMLRLETADKKAIERAARLVKVKPSAWVREVALRAAKRNVKKG